jgi:hypothetical protein
MFKLTIRKTLDSFLSLFDWLRRPKPIVRTEEESRKLSKATSGLALYDYKGCMASRKTRHEIRRLNIDIERRDIEKCSIHLDSLLAEFGKLKAPCLRIEEKGEVQWISEPDKILHFLHKRFDIKGDNAGHQKNP